ncbi:hypothetical protein RND81_09G036800 [Saponaria officinalis]|uniref:Phytocyanin domain-containing protein n=1 Tax=Saponaria officinalis TaxID=3572 RepID=A0AAW1IH72_SAPOF
MAKCSCIIIGFLGIMFLMQGSEATTFTVGGSKGWSVPNDNNVYNQWAEKMRFQIGDSLLFVYQASSDSVLQVSKEDYTNCNTNSPISKFNDGHTLFNFNQSGPYYFISGSKDNCNKNEKLVVVVLADRTTKTPSSPPSPAPSPTTTVASASPPSPTTTAQASPAPSAEANPPPRNGATSFVMGFGSLLGAFASSSILLAF